MKKTILTAVLSLSLAFGASAASSLDDLTYAMGAVSGAGAQTIPTGTTFSTASGNYDQFTMTVVFDSAKLLETVTGITATTTNKAIETAYNSNSNKLGIGFKVTVADDGSKTIQAVAQAGGATNDSSPSSDLMSLISNNDNLILTLVYNGNGGTTLYTYNPDTDTVTAGVTATGYKYTNTSHNAYNSLWATSPWCNAIEGIYMFNTASDDTGVLAISKAVPEPTTATLSLLALAGLTARRRRK